MAFLALSRRRYVGVPHHRIHVVPLVAASRGFHIRKVAQAHIAQINDASLTVKPRIESRRTRAPYWVEVAVPIPAHLARQEVVAVTLLKGHRAGHGADRPERHVPDGRLASHDPDDALEPHVRDVALGTHDETGVAALGRGDAVRPLRGRRRRQIARLQLHRGARDRNARQGRDGPRQRSLGGRHDAQGAAVGRYVRELVCVSRAQVDRHACRQLLGAVVAAVGHAVTVKVDDDGEAAIYASYGKT